MMYVMLFARICSYRFKDKVYTMCAYLCLCDINFDDFFYVNGIQTSNNNAVKLFSVGCLSQFGWQLASVFVYHRFNDSRLLIVSFSVRFV